MAYITSWIVTQKKADLVFDNHDDFWLEYSLPALKQKNILLKQKGVVPEAASLIMPGGKTVIYSKKWVNKIDYLDYQETQSKSITKQRKLLDFKPTVEHTFSDKVEAWVLY